MLEFGKNRCERSSADLRERGTKEGRSRRRRSVQKKGPTLINHRARHSGNAGARTLNCVGWKKKKGSTGWGKLKICEVEPQTENIIGIYRLS